MGSETEGHELLSTEGKARSGLTLSLLRATTVRQRTRRAARRTVELGAKKGKWKEMDVFIMGKWTCTSPSARLAVPATLHRPPAIFPFLFSPRYPHLQSCNCDLPTISPSPRLILPPLILPLSSSVFPALALPPMCFEWSATRLIRPVALDSAFQ